MSADEEPTALVEAPQSTTGTGQPPELKLRELRALATQQYALKNYAEAAETYSEAAELQDEVNGEMATDNAELLYQYGRCLYHLGVSKSDVLGGKVAQQEEPKRKKRKITRDEDTAEGSSSSAVKQETPAEIPGASKPFFQITGDENWTDSEEEEEEEAEGGEEEDDDLAIAYEILDTARVLLQRNLEYLEGSGANPGPKHDQEVRALKERLADTHDLQAEIKLENEQFADAISDAQQALTYKLLLYPQESGMIAEAHYKLSIALDFAAMPTQTEDAEGKPAPSTTTEEEQTQMRKQAAEEMEKAILSCQLRIKKDEASLANLIGAKLESTKKGIADVKDMVQDMKNRLVDLRNPAAKADEDAANPLKGLLGEMLGASKADQIKMIAKATEGANDLSGMIKKKKPKAEPEEVDGKGKRKLEDAEPIGTGKKVKFEEP